MLIKSDGADVSALSHAGERYAPDADGIFDVPHDLGAMLVRLGGWGEVAPVIEESAPEEPPADPITPPVGDEGNAQSEPVSEPVKAPAKKRAPKKPAPPAE